MTLYCLFQTSLWSDHANQFDRLFLTLGTIAVRSVYDSNRQLYPEAQRRVLQQLYVVSDINIACLVAGL